MGGICISRDAGRGGQNNCVFFQAPAYYLGPLGSNHASRCVAALLRSWCAVFPRLCAGPAALGAGMPVLPAVALLGHGASWGLHVRGSADPREPLTGPAAREFSQGASKCLGGPGSYGKHVQKHRVFQSVPPGRLTVANESAP